LPALLSMMMLVGCNNKPEPIEILYDYEFPLDSLKGGKSFVFQDRVSHQIGSYQRKKVVDGGVVYLEEEDYKNYAIYISSRQRITEKGTLYEACYKHLAAHDTAKGFPMTILESRSVHDGRQYRGTHRVFRGEWSHYWERLVFDEVFEKQDTLHWYGEVKDVLVFTYNKKYSTRNRYFPFNTVVYEEENGKNYYAKGIGLIRSTSESSDWILTGIMLWTFPMPGGSPL
jgi:hypothetical protein